MSNKFLTFLTYIFIVLSVSSRSEAIKEVPLNEIGCDLNSEPFLIASEKGELIIHRYFVLSYSEKDEQPYWISYLFEKKHLENKVVERTNNFREDDAISTGSASPEDYSKSGYDRGHLCPADDFASDSVAMSESFLMSNMSPQVPSFNRGVWKRLENQVRKWVEQYGKLIIVSGGVLTDSLPKIGANEVSVPQNFYKIIFSVSEPKARMIGFIIPNAKSSATLNSFAVPIDSIEAITGLDFFPTLPDSIENVLEGSVKEKDWFIE
jgi:endonuclease G, mitochondrial